MRKVSIVVPVFHNELSLPDLFSALQALPSDIEFEFVLVDDGSGDGSWLLLEEFVGREPRAKAVKLSRNFGSAMASSAGLGQATGDAAVMLAADLQDPPELIPQMIDLWKQGNEVVLAVRERRDEPLIKKALAAAYYRLMRWFALPDMPTGGFSLYLIDRKVIDFVVSAREKNTALSGLVLWSGFRRETLPYHRKTRSKGRNMWTLAKKLKLVVDSFVSFSRFPIRVIQALGILSVFGGAAYGAALLVENSRGEGWSTVMVALLILGGLNLLMLGVVGEYIWRSLDETKRRPPFLIDRIAEGSSEAMSSSPELIESGRCDAQFTR